MNTNQQQALDAALVAAQVLGNPNVALAATLVPVAIQFLQNASALHDAGVLSTDQLAYLFVSTGQGIQDTHNKWAAMNKADALKSAGA